MYRGMTPFFIYSEDSLGDHLPQYFPKSPVTIRELTMQNGYGRLHKVVNEADARRETRQGLGPRFYRGFNNRGGAEAAAAPRAALAVPDTSFARVAVARSPHSTRL